MLAVVRRRRCSSASTADSAARTRRASPVDESRPRVHAHHEQSRARARKIERQLDEVRRQQERLLNLHLSGSVDEQALGAKNTELCNRISALTLQLESTDRQQDERADLALRVFELSQDRRRKWVNADDPEKAADSESGVFELGAERRNARHFNEKALQLPG
jgi:hypothetical protein